MRTFITAAFGLVFVLGSTKASAFCRATTCNEAKQVCEKDAKGCVTEGTPVSWRSSTLEYHLHDRGTRTLVRAETRAVIRAAFGTWSDVLCEGNLRTRLRFVEREDISLDQSETADSSDPTRNWLPRDFPVKKFWKCCLFVKEIDNCVWYCAPCVRQTQAASIFGGNPVPMDSSRSVGQTHEPSLGVARA